MIKNILIKGFFYIIGSFLFLLITYSSIIYLIYDVSYLDNFTKPEPTKIFDTNEKIYNTMDYSSRRKVISIKNISKDLINAVISTEDHDFYNHHGFSYKGILRAILGRGGGSTITQQLAKNMFLSQERTFIRKFKEIIIAIKIENYISKDKILEIYLNEIYWGDNGYYGIESASNYFFGKSAKDLDLYESTLIAGILPAPELWSPKVDFKKAKWRQSLVLENMVRNNYISKEESEKTKAITKKLYNGKFYRQTNYPYFTDYVLEKLEKIDRRYFDDKFLSHGGLKIYTTLNQDYQKKAENILSREISKLKKYNVTQGALISINPKNGYIRAFVGGNNYSGINRIFSKRQPASAFKPFVYLTYYNEWFSSGEDIFEDTIENATFKNALEVNCKEKNYTLKQENKCYKNYVISNYTGNYLGKVTLDNAIKKSLNTIPIKIASEIGIDNIIKTAKSLGIKSHLKHELGTALGSSEVTPFELISAYLVFANGGYKINKITPIVKILDKNNKIIYEHDIDKTQVYSSRSIYKLNQSLLKVVEEGTGKNAYINGRKIAGKTGTTSDHRDAWFIGYTPDLVTLVWLGNDDNSKMNNIVGSDCAEIFRKYTSAIINNIPNESFPEQDNIFVDTYFELKKVLGINEFF
ncbi:MAG: transglycosylase domain-containing protein [Candidatus Sericytochromatia bacterium]